MATTIALQPYDERAIVRHLARHVSADTILTSEEHFLRQVQMRPISTATYTHPPTQRLDLTSILDSPSDIAHSSVAFPTSSLTSPILSPGR